MEGFFHVLLVLLVFTQFTFYAIYLKISFPGFLGWITNHFMLLMDAHNKCPGSQIHRLKRTLMENVLRQCTKNYTQTQTASPGAKLSLTGAAIHQILHLKYPIAFWLLVQIINNQEVVPTPPTVEEQKEGNKSRYFQNGNVDQKI